MQYKYFLHMILRIQQTILTELKSGLLHPSADLETPQRGLLCMQVGFFIIIILYHLSYHSSQPHPTLLTSEQHMVFALVSFEDDMELCVATDLERQRMTHGKLNA